MLLKNTQKRTTSICASVRGLTVCHIQGNQDYLCVLVCEYVRVWARARARVCVCVCCVCSCLDQYKCVTTARVRIHSLKL